MFMEMMGIQTAVNADKNAVAVYTYPMIKWIILSTKSVDALTRNVGLYRMEIHILVLYYNA
jgi:hypothetical protein